MAVDLAKLVVRLETENSKLVEGLQKATREVDRFRKDAESAADRVGAAFKNLAAIGLSVGAFTAVTSSIKDMVNQADNLSKLSQKVGVTVESLSALNYAASLADVSTEQLGNGLKKLSANAADTARGTGDAADAFRALGIDVKNASGGIKSADELLGEVADKFADAEDGVNKTAIAMKLFGKSGADLIPLLNEGSAGLAELRAEAERLGVVISGDTAKSAELFNDNLTRLGFAATGLKLAVAESALPALTKITTAMSEAAKEAGLLKAAWVGLGGVMFEVLMGGEIGEAERNVSRLARSIQDLSLQIAKTGGTPEQIEQLHQLTAQAREADKELRRLRDEQTQQAKETAAAAGSCGKQLASLTKETKGLSDAQKAAKKEQDAYVARLSKLVGELDPVALKTQNYMQAVADLDRAWIEGNLSGEEHDRLLMELATDYDAIKKAADEAAKAEEKAAKDRAEIAKQNAEAMQRPFEHAAEGIQDAFTGAFEDIFSGNVRNFSDLAGEIKQVFVRLAAEVATLMVFNPRASFGAILGGTGLFGSSTAAAGAQLAGGGGSGGLVSGLSGLAGMSKLLSNNGRGFGSILGDTSWGNIGANIGAGFAGNALGGWAANKWGGGKSGGNVGGTIGGAIGSIWGPIGSFVGSALGNFVGSFIGAGPSDRTQAGSVNLGTGSIYNQHGLGGKKFSQENANLRDQVLQQASQFAQMLRETTGGTISQALSVVIGNRDGLRYQFGSGPLQNAGKSVDALMAGINRGIVNSLSGIPAELKAVVNRIDFSNLQQAAQDIAFANAIIKKEFVRAEPLNAAAQAIAALNDQFKPLIDNAQRLGLSIAPINAEMAKQRALLTRGFNDEIDRAILSITDPLAAALAAFDDVAADRLDNARTLGADLLDVERLNALERAQIVEQYGQQANGALRQANQSIEQFLTGLRTGGAYLSPAATLANAESEFSRLLGLAQGGDVAARGGLSGAAGALLEASREAWGSSEMFFQRLNFVESSLGNLIGQGSSTTTFDNLGVTIAQGNSSLEYQLVQLNNKVAELTAVVADQQASLARLAAA